MQNKRIFKWLIVVLFMIAATPLWAAETGHEIVHGADLSLLWGIPFAGILLSIALGPILFPKFWHHYYGLITLGWAVAFLVPFTISFGAHTAFAATLHAFLHEYMPFIILIGALYTIAGGIYVQGNLHGSPILNTALLATGTVLASLIGTTGASMVLIRPILRANDERIFRAHVVIFFIFLVSNVGGSLSPIGDPPLFLGFLKGVDFFWPTTHLFTEMLFVSVALLVIFFAMDSYFYSREEGLPHPKDPTPDSGVRIKGLPNIVLILIAVGCVIATASWNNTTKIPILGDSVELRSLARDGLLLLCAITSLLITPKTIRKGNGFNWEPVLEVGKLFAGIFLVMVPVIAILKAGMDGQLAPLVSLVTNPDGSPNNQMYFWVTGVLSSFLDNAPTYLVFFNLAGGNADVLMTDMAMTLAAISCGAVFMGANSYIGNAPNFMVRSIAENSGVKMPSFFGYMLWSAIFLLPLFALVTWIFF